MGVKERKLREFQKRQEEILATAYELLIKLEPIQMTMEMIAEKTEIGRGTIYKHFKSKDEIYAHLMLKRREKYIEVLKSVLKEEKDLLQNLLQSYLTYSTNNKEAFIVHKKCINHYIRSNIKTEIIELMDIQDNEKIKLIESIMEKGFQELSLNPPNTRYLIYAGWGMLRGAMDFMMESNINREILDKEQFYHAIKEIFFSGLGIGR